MESSSSRLEGERLKQTQLKKQIALLQSQLKDIPPEHLVTNHPTSPKRKQPESKLLVPPTPSPKKRKLDHKPGNRSLARSAVQPNRHISGSLQHGPAISGVKPAAKEHVKPAASNVLSRLSSISGSLVDMEATKAITRSSAFTEAPPTNHVRADEDVFSDRVPKRDERLVLIEDLEPGPVEHTPPLDDPEFQTLEPNSGIRLASRAIPHDELQDHLRGRFYLSPSRLYSAIRLLPDKQGYDIPVPGDWITIAVVAERGPLKFTRAPVAVGPEEGIEKQDTKANGKRRAEPLKATGKKYVNLKLVDFGLRSRSSSSATGGKAVISGDAFLSLLLFESDGFDLMMNEGGEKSKRVYRGGSGGAFEALSKVKEGDVIALLNPKILKPFQRSTGDPHPTNNILAITPESASSIMVIGRARDLGMCAAIKRDGKVCGSWCDKRVSQVCEWHVQAAVERRRAGRAEFSIGTTGMSTSSVPKRKPAYDPARQWGLKPADAESGGTGATYVVSGHVVSGSGTLDSRTLYQTENLGRDGQAKAKRKMSGKDSDKALMGLLEKDKDGMKAVMKAREAIKIAEGKGKMNKDDKGKEKEGREEKGKSKSKTGVGEMGKDAGSGLGVNTAKNAYSAEVIKQLGFDPIAKAGQRRGGDSDMQKKLEALAAVQSARKGIILVPRRGQKLRSCVIAPKESVVNLGITPAAMIDLDE